MGVADAMIEAEENAVTADESALLSLWPGEVEWEVRPASPGQADAAATAAASGEAPSPARL